MNYCEIFDDILNSKNQIPLPVPWIWDILDEYIFQFFYSCKQLKLMKHDDEVLQNVLKNEDDINFWNLEKVLHDLNTIINRSKIIKEEGNKRVLVPIENNGSTIQYFGYFALVALLRVYVSIGDFENALKVIEPIDFKSLSVISKSVPAYLTLFSYAGFCYLMTSSISNNIYFLKYL